MGRDSGPQPVWRSGTTRLVAMVDAVFAAGFALLSLFRCAHVRWSRRYRHEGAVATLLSLLAWRKRDVLRLSMADA